uniref:Major facilitator superfamily (MFS) profile domain-containing protein n=1 Tax=Musca domestica TaxID=7370 RepID=A0A1I8NB95_MUSDO
HTWQIFLLVCGLPSFISGVILLFLPESPKFLMSQGHNGEAMRAFQTIYALNTRKPKNTFPIKRLIEEVPTRDVVSNEAVFTIEKTSDVTPKRLHRSMSQSLRDGWQQTKPMFSKPLLTRALHHQNVSVDMYMNNMIVSISGIVGYCFAGLIVRAVGNKRLLTYGLLISGGLGLSLYWSSSGLTTLIISSMFITLCGISTSSLMGMVVGLFPTTLRTMIVALSMMFGRLGALSGNLMFPVLIEIGCIPPFAMVGSVLI